MNVRYVKAKSWLYHSPGGSGFAALPEGQAVEVVRDREGNVVRHGDFVMVQPLDERGRPSGSRGWISAGVLKQRPEPERFLMGDILYGPAGLRLAEGRCTFGYRRCAATAQQVDPRLPRPIGTAANYVNPRHKNALMHHGWVEVTDPNDLRPDDVVIWGPTKRNPAGHIGFIALKPNGEPIIVSNLEGRRAFHGFGAVGGRATVWRYVGG